jgi:hypothetical protein
MHLRSLIVMILSLLYARSFAAEIKIPAYVEVKFTTTVNVSTVGAFNENTGAVEMVFPINKHLYEPMDNLPEDVTGLSINSIKISAPALTGSENLTASIRMAYKKSMQDTAVPLYSADNQPAITLKTGASMISEPGLSDFNNTLLSDIKNINVPREFNVVIFVIKIRLEGTDASTIELDDLNLQLELTANVTTKATVMD